MTKRRSSTFKIIARNLDYKKKKKKDYLAIQVQILYQLYCVVRQKSKSEIEKILAYTPEKILAHI